MGLLPLLLVQPHCARTEWHYNGLGRYIGQHGHEYLGIFLRGLDVKQIKSTHQCFVQHFYGTVQLQEHSQQWEAIQVVLVESLWGHGEPEVAQLA